MVATCVMYIMDIATEVIAPEAWFTGAVYIRVDRLPAPNQRRHPAVAVRPASPVDIQAKRSAPVLSNMVSRAASPDEYVAAVSAQNIGGDPPQPASRCMKPWGLGALA